MSAIVSNSPKTLASSISYLPFGGITALIYGNDLSLTQDYDNQYRISSIITGSLLYLTYGYDENGNVNYYPGCRELRQDQRPLKSQEPIPTNRDQMY